MIRHIKVKIIHLATLNQFYNKDSTGEMDLKELCEKIKLLTLIVIQDIMLFFIDKVFQCILYFREDFRLNFYYFPLKVVDTKSPYTFEQQSSKSNRDHNPIKESETIKTNHTIPLHVPVPHKVPDRYKPLILPPTLHAFPKNYPKNLPRFEGENGITAQKHSQSFEDYLNLFEVDEEDVSIRVFALSLQDKVKSWFKPFLRQASQISSSFSNSSFIDG